MPSTKTKPRTTPKKRRTAPPRPAELPDVLTSAEAAEYLRVSEEDLLRSAVEQGLPGRMIGAEWRFLKSALDEWLRASSKPTSKQALLKMAGAFKDDPFLEDIVREAYERRGRPMAEKAG